MPAQAAETRKAAELRKPAPRCANPRIWLTDCENLQRGLINRTNRNRTRGGPLALLVSDNNFDGQRWCEGVEMAVVICALPHRPQLHAMRTPRFVGWIGGVIGGGLGGLRAESEKGVSGQIGISASAQSRDRESVSRDAINAGDEYCECADDTEIHDPGRL